MLKGERSVALRAWREPKAHPARRRRRGGGRRAASVGKEPLRALRTWRVEAARRHGVPAYVIFHDATLREVARARPSSLDELRGISGVGAKKLEAYGADIIGLVVARAPDRVLAAESVLPVLVGHVGDARGCGSPAAG